MPKVIAHISDTHFGIEFPHVVDILVDKLNFLKPELIIFSGDLTQRARKPEFAQCQDFLIKLEAPKLIIPGNHDIPLLNFVRRFFKPLQYYKEYITADLLPQVTTSDLRVLGINSSRNYRWKRGEVSVEQIEKINNFFSKTEKTTFNILAIHHNLLEFDADNPEERLRKRRRFIDGIKNVKIDLIVSGHLHLRKTKHLADYPLGTTVPLLLQAGTSTSQRRRIEPNSFNIIEIDSNEFFISVLDFDGKDFQISSREKYSRKEEVKK